jgi:hypothetical protein
MGACEVIARSIQERGVLIANGERFGKNNKRKPGGS